MADPALERRAYAAAGYARDRDLTIALARKDPATFMRFVLRDEATGRPIAQAPVHDAWQDELTQHARLVLWAHIEAGKTNQITIGRTLWELGRNPTLRVAIISRTHEQAQKIVRTIAQYITKSAELRAVFPHLRPATDKSLPWTTTAITVERHTLSKDPSVRAAGVEGDILGARVDLLIIDDILDFTNTQTVDQMEKVYRWVMSTPMGRLDAKARVWVVGNAWHPRDLMHTLAEQGFTPKRSPVEDAAGEPTWPERWPRERIAASRKELGPLEFTRQLLCVARDEATARFQHVWIDACAANGNGYRFVHEVAALPDGYAIFTGVDLGISPNHTADPTCFFTLLAYPDGRRQVLGIESGRWQAPEIIARIEDHAARYDGLIIVENNQGQDYILQMTRRVSRARLKAFRTGRNKADPTFGVESLAAEMAAERWIIPSRGGRVTNQEAQAWIKEMLFYSPKGHTGDRLMASWFAREGARAWERSLPAAAAAPGLPAGTPGTVSVRVIG